MNDQDREEGQLDEYSYAPPAPYQDQASSSHYTRPAYERSHDEQRGHDDHAYYERHDRRAPAYDERRGPPTSHHPHTYYDYQAYNSHSAYARDSHYQGYTVNTHDTLDAAPVWNGQAPKVGTQMRLVALESDVLPSGQKVAIVDARDEGVSIGRDRSFTARIRLPSMSISKHHANLFLMPARTHDASAVWSVTDAGSTHGSFHLSSHAVPPNAQAKNVASTRFTRLSEPKKASAPHPLAHGDWLRFGEGTTFEVHLHGAGAWACAKCSLGTDGTGEIPLKATSDASTTTARTGSIPLSAAAAAGAALLDASVVKPDTATGKTRAKVDRKIESEVQRRQKMRQMREHFLGEDTTKIKSNPSVSSTAPASATSEEGAAVLGADETAPPKYIDRAAARRARNPDGPIPKRWGKRRSASPPPAATAASTTINRAASAARAPTPPSPPRARAAPLDASNVGFRMLQQMTGGASGSGNAKALETAPSTGAGIGSARFAAPLVVRGTEGRAGLGSGVLRDAEEIGAQSMGVVWALNETASSSPVGSGRGRGAAGRGEGGERARGRGAYGGKDATRRRYEESLAYGAGR